MNEVKILVRTQNAAKAGFNEVNKDIDDFAKRSAETFTKRFSENLTQNLKQHLTTQLTQIGQQAEDAARAAGNRIGDTIGRNASERITTRITESLRRDSNGRLHDERGRYVSENRSGGMVDRDRDRVHVDVDVDKQSFLQKLLGFGKEAGSKFGSLFKDGFSNVLSGVFSGDFLSTILKGGIVAFAVSTLGPIIGSAVTTGILTALGGGVLAIGIASAIKNPQIAAAYKSLGTMAKQEFADFGKYFTGPVANFAEGLLKVFRQVSPMIDHLGQVFGPVADKVGKGLIGLLQNMLPGIMRAMEASAPLIETLANNLPGIGDAIGRFFDHIKNGAPDANIFFNDLLHGVRLVIRILGNLIEILTRMYSVARTVLVGMIQLFINWGSATLAAANIAFGWIPGLGPKLRSAQNKMLEFKNDFNRYLRQIPSEKTITFRFRVLGQAAANAAVRTAQILAGMSHGGIKGAADGGLKEGLTWVGEHGPELVKLPPGAQVHSAGDSARLAGQGGGPTAIQVALVADRTTERGVVDAVMQMLRAEIFNVAGGDVQQALGR